MTVQPTIISYEQVVEQSQVLAEQKKALEETLRQLEKRTQQIESSLKENDTIKAQVKELIHLSFSHFQTEWKRKSEFFPEIRVGILQKALDLNPPPTPKK